MVVQDMANNQKKRYAFILRIIRILESLNKGVICFSHEDVYPDGSYRWDWICIDDYYIYTRDARYKELAKRFSAEAKKIGINIAFCYCSISEEKLLELAENDNLIMNV